MTTNERRGTTHVGDLGNVTPNELLRVQRLARELRLTDQILTNDLDAVAVEATGPAPAWTTLDGDRVSFAYQKMPKPYTRVDVAVWLGTNAHEIGHVLFSPRRESTLMYRVIESDKAWLSGMKTIHNIVEDQRQERLLLARFSPWAGYLTAALGHHLVADDDSAWLLMTGRTWLPDSVRTTAKARMIASRGQRETDEVTRLVGEYQRLTDPGDTQVEEAWELLEALHALFADNIPPSGGGCTVMTGGQPSTDDPDEGQAPDTADEADARPPTPPPDRGDGKRDTDDGDTDDADTDGDGNDGADDGDESDRGNGGGDDDQSTPDQRDDGGDSGGSGAGDEPRTDSPFSHSDARRELKASAVEQIDGDDDARDDLDAVLDNLDHGRPGESAEGDDASGSFHDASVAARLLHREVADALLDLKDESEPGWNRRVDSGRLSVRRLLDPNVDADELFDRYEPGMMDASELEVVLMLDVSGSMGNHVYRLGEATWAIRQAVDDLEGRITVLTYDSGPHRVLAEPGERPDGRMFVPTAQGGTQPRSALREALRLLSGADARNRLLIVLTDGDWYDASGDAVIETLNSLGVTTVMAELGGYAERPVDLHGCQFGAHVDDPTELARLFRKVATERITSWQ